MTKKTCSKCDYEHCAGPYGFPCAGQGMKAEDRYWSQAVGTTELSARGYRSYWD